MEEIKKTQIIIESPDPNRASRQMAGIILIGLTAFFLLSVFYRPSEVRSDGEYFTICAFKNIIGLPCPGCGLVHSVCALGKGRLVESVQFNLLGPAVYLLAFAVWLRSICVIADWSRAVAWMDRAAARIKLIWTFTAMFIVFGLSRIIYLLLAR